MTYRDRERGTTSGLPFVRKWGFQSRGVPHVHLIDGVPSEIEGRDRET